MRTWVAGVLCCVFVGFSPVSVQAEPDIAARQSLKETSEKTPGFLSSTGAFTYDIALEVPEYRSIAPNLRINYDSGWKGLGSSDATIGPGWQLSGLSSIVRGSLSDGVPTYDNLLDVYRLDGETLLACKNGTSQTFSNQYPWDYPAARVATRANASCSFGGADAGRLTTLRESNLRITVAATQINGRWVNHFVVTDKKGTKYTYRAVGVAGGLTPTSDNNLFMPLFAREFVLTEIRDTQSTPNIVTITYTVDGQANGWAHRPVSITYSGYAVEFSYQDVTTLSPAQKPMATWGLGRGVSYLGKQRHRLTSIVMKDGATTIRAYSFQYATTAFASRSILTGVREFGSDAVLTQGVITGGSSLPGYTFSYQNDEPSWQMIDFTQNLAFHVMNTVADLDQDGKDEAIFLQHSVSNVGGSGNYTMLRAYYELGSTRASMVDLSQDAKITTLPASSSNSGHDSSAYFSNLGLFSNYTQTNDGIFEKTQMISVYANVSLTNSGSSFTASLKVHSVGSGAEIGTSVPFTASTCMFGFVPQLLGNFDNDPGKEVLLGERIFDINSDGSVVERGWAKGDVATLCAHINALGAIGRNDEKLWLADIDGDGIDEIVTRNAYYRRESRVVDDGTPFKKYSFDPVAFDGIDTSYEIGFGDFNGDGLADVVFQSCHVDQRIWVGLGTGS